MVSWNEEFESLFVVIPRETFTIHKAFQSAKSYVFPLMACGGSPHMDRLPFNLFTIAVV